MPIRFTCPRCFPPAYVAYENGRPMHSRRVLILRDDKLPVDGSQS